jgi:hypothetical protein
MTSKTTNKSPKENSGRTKRDETMSCPSAGKFITRPNAKGLRSGSLAFIPILLRTVFFFYERVLQSTLV